MVCRQECRLEVVPTVPGTTAGKIAPSSFPAPHFVVFSLRSACTKPHMKSYIIEKILHVVTLLVGMVEKFMAIMVLFASHSMYGSMHGGGHAGTGSEGHGTMGYNVHAAQQHQMIMQQNHMQQQHQQHQQQQQQQQQQQHRAQIGGDANDFSEMSSHTRTDQGDSQAPGSARAAGSFSMQQVPQHHPGSHGGRPGPASGGQAMRPHSNEADFNAR